MEIIQENIEQTSVCFTLFMHLFAIIYVYYPPPFENQ